MSENLEEDECYDSIMDLEEEEEEAGEFVEGVLREAFKKETMEECMQTIEGGCPEYYCRSYISIKARVLDRYAERPAEWTSSYTLADFINVPRTLSDYAKYINSEEEVEQPKGLIVISPTRFGKTQWARSINPNHAHLQGEWDPDCIRDDARVLIFDDVSMFELLPGDRWKVFMGMEPTFYVTGKYRAARRVIRGWKGFIYLGNVDPRTEDGVSKEIADYITSKCDIVTLDTKLYL